MSPEDAVTLLAAASRTNDTSESALILVTELGYLPLAIIQAGAFIAKCGLTFTDYLDMYRVGRAELLNSASTQTIDAYKHPVYTTWEMSVQKLSSCATSLLRVFGFLHNEGITLEILRRAVSHLNDPRATDPFYASTLTFLQNFCNRNGQWNSLTFFQTVTELLSYSLINPSGPKSWSVHPLVHAWSRDRLSEEERRFICQLAIGVLSLCLDSANACEDHMHRRSMVPHIDVHRGAEVLKSHADTSHWFSMVYMSAERYNDSEHLLLCSIENQIRLRGKDDPLTLWRKNKLAETYDGQGRYDEAEVLRSEVLEFQKRVLGLEHPDTLQTMSELGLCYAAQGHYPEAEVLLVEALNLQSKVLGQEHPHTLRCMSNLALTLHRQGQYAQAEVLDVKVVDIRKRLFGLEHPDTLVSMNNLAVTFWRQGRCAEAEAVQVEVLALRRSVLGEETLRHWRSCTI